MGCVCGKRAYINKVQSEKNSTIDRTIIEIIITLLPWRAQISRNVRPQKWPLPRAVTLAVCPAKAPRRRCTSRSCSSNPSPSLSHLIYSTHKWVKKKRTIIKVSKSKNKINASSPSRRRQKQTISFRFKTYRSSRRSSHAQSSRWRRKRSSSF